MTPPVQISYSLATIHSAVHQFLKYMNQHRVLAFSGQLGAGKTTFIHNLCEILGVTDPVSSPTFALINEYRFKQNGSERIIYHMDWYRVNDTEEAINAGMEDALLNPDAICMIEWPEQATDLLPHPHLWISIEATGPEERLMTIEAR